MGEKNVLPCSKMVNNKHRKFEGVLKTSVDGMKL